MDGDEVSDEISLNPKNFNYYFTICYINIINAYKNTKNNLADPGYWTQSLRREFIRTYYEKSTISNTYKNK